MSFCTCCFSVNSQDLVVKMRYIRDTLKPDSIKPGMGLINHHLDKKDSLYQLAIEDYAKWILDKLRRCTDSGNDEDFLEEASFMIHCLYLNDIYPKDVPPDMIRWARQFNGNYWEDFLQYLAKVYGKRNELDKARLVCRIFLQNMEHLDTPAKMCTADEEKPYISYICEICHVPGPCGKAMVLELAEPDGVQFLGNVLAYAQSCDDVQESFLISSQLLPIDGILARMLEERGQKEKDVNVINILLKSPEFLEQLQSFLASRIRPKTATNENTEASKKGSTGLVICLYAEFLIHLAGFEESKQMFKDWDFPLEILSVLKLTSHKLWAEWRDRFQVCIWSMMFAILSRINDEEFLTSSLQLSTIQEYAACAKDFREDEDGDDGWIQDFLDFSQSYLREFVKQNSNSRGANPALDIAVRMTEEILRKHEVETKKREGVKKFQELLKNKATSG